MWNHEEIVDEALAPFAKFFTEAGFEIFRGRMLAWPGKDVVDFCEEAHSPIPAGVCHTWEECLEELQTLGSAALAIGPVESATVVVWAKPRDCDLLVVVAWAETVPFIGGDIRELKAILGVNESLQDEEGERTLVELQATACLSHLMSLERSGALDELHKKHCRGVEVPRVLPPELEIPPMSKSERADAKKFFDDNLGEIMLLSKGAPALSGMTLSGDALEPAFMSMCSTLPRWRIPLTLAKVDRDDAQLTEHVEQQLQRVSKGEHRAPYVQLQLRALAPYAPVLSARLFRHVAEQLYAITASHPNMVDVVGHLFGDGDIEAVDGLGLLPALINSGWLRAHLLERSLPTEDELRRALMESPWGGVDDPICMHVLNVMSRAPMRLPEPARTEAALMQYVRGVLASTLASLIGIDAHEPLWVKTGISLDEDLGAARKLLERALEELDDDETLVIQNRYIERWDFKTTTNVVGRALKDSVQLHRRAVARLGEAIARAHGQSDATTAAPTGAPV